MFRDVLVILIYSKIIVIGSHIFLKMNVYTINSDLMGLLGTMVLIE